MTPSVFFSLLVLLLFISAILVGSILGPFETLKYKDLSLSNYSLNNIDTFYTSLGRNRVQRDFEQQIGN